MVSLNILSPNMIIYVLIKIVTHVLNLSKCIWIQGITNQLIITYVCSLDS